MAASYTGNPVAVEAPSSAPGAGVAPIISLPDNGDGATWANVAQGFKTAADFIAWLTLQVLGVGLGDGSDGSCAFDGSSTIAGLVPVSNVYTLTKDLNATTITFAGSAKLVTTGYRVYARGAITTTGSGIVGGGIIVADGAAGASGATGGAGGAAGATGILLAGTAGGNGGGAGSGGAGTNATNALGGAGGNGGAPITGTGGTVAAPAISLGSMHVLSPSTLGMLVGNSAGSGTITLPKGGAGGQGGGNSGFGGSQGGGGGAGGAIVAVMARTLTLKTAADIRAAGGAGGAGLAGSSWGSGGGGGGGGAAVIAYATYTTGDATVLQSSLNAPGGALGTFSGVGGANGAAGSTGTCYPIAIGGF